MIPVFQVDAFASEKFKGNPAAVCPLNEWMSDDLLQKIASEINLSETAFFVKNANGFHLRWFTPTDEVRLCGHATLATAHVLFSHLNYELEEILFSTQKAGELKVSKNNQGYTLNFPADIPFRIDEDLCSDFIDQAVVEQHKGLDDYLLILESEEAVRKCQANFHIMKSKAGHRAVIISAQGDNKDFVSRVFAPCVGIDEDPVTGSAHTVLTPYWSRKLSKTKLNAEQVSKRTGQLQCEIKGDRVLISGQAVTSIKGEILI